MIPTATIIEVGLHLADGLAKLIMTIQSSKEIDDAEKARAIAQIRARLLSKDQQVQNVVP